MGFTRIILFIGVSLYAMTAHAGLIQINGDFEDDLSKVPNQGDESDASPTGWQYDSDYHGYGKDPKLMNVSHIDNGKGGDVGVKFPNWNDDDGWDALVVQFGPEEIVAGAYELTTVIAGLGLSNSGKIEDNQFQSDLYWIEDLANPWVGGWGRLVDTGWIKLAIADNGMWQTHTWSFVVAEDDAAVGNYFATWIKADNYDGHIILGEATLRSVSVPEPSIIALFGLGLIGLGFARRRKAQAQ